MIQSPATPQAPGVSLHDWFCSILHPSVAVKWTSGAPELGRNPFPLGCWLLFCKQNTILSRLPFSCFHYDTVRDVSHSSVSLQGVSPVFSSFDPFDLLASRPTQPWPNSAAPPRLSRWPPNSTRQVQRFEPLRSAGAHRRSKLTPSGRQNFMFNGAHEGRVLEISTCGQRLRL